MQRYILYVIYILPESLSQHMGQHSNCPQKVAAYFTQKLSQQLYNRKQHQHPKTSAEDLANVFHFDCFVSVTAVPGHFHSGSINYFLQLCFSLLQTDPSKGRVYMGICSYISTSHLPRIEAVLP